MKFFFCSLDKASDSFLKSNLEHHGCQAYTIDKLRFKIQTDTELIPSDTEFMVRLTPDKDKKTIEISDNGIGMTYDEVLENIGTIAKSGTAAFLEAMEKSKNIFSPIG